VDAEASRDVVREQIDRLRESTAYFTDCPDGPRCREARQTAIAVARIFEAQGHDARVQRIFGELTFLAALNDTSGRAAFPSIRSTEKLIAKLAVRALDASDKGREDSEIADDLLFELYVAEQRARSAGGR
jgi:hypothetical protein